MSVSRPRLRIVWFTLVALLVLVPAAIAQTRARVTKDQTMIWRPGFTTLGAVVKAGTLLDVIAQQGDWYEVALPASGGRATGFISASRVELVGGPLSPSQIRQPAPRRPPPPPRQIAVRAIGDFGYASFDARQSFNAVFSQTGTGFYGGGGEVASNRWFARAAVEHLELTGERVFAFQGDVFKLGIPDTLRIIPVTVSGGYYFKSHGAFPYVGAGVGRYFVRETSAFTDSSEAFRKQFMSYHAVFGVEWRNGLGYATALELQYTHVPHSLSGGLAAAFDEHNLGGLHAGMRVSFGH